MKVSRAMTPDTKGFFMNLKGRWSSIHKSWSREKVRPASSVPAPTSKWWIVWIMGSS